MNYRHAFHAGNFADLLKHVVLTALLERLVAQAGALEVIDTHAGAGAYDLSGAASVKTGEAERGIVRLLAATDAPAVFDGLKAATSLPIYPGSPTLIAARLRPGDSYLGCELRADDFARLAATLKRYRGARALQADGFATAAAKTPPAPTRTLVLIDPPFERPDDYARIEETTRRILQRNAAAVIAVWLPIKDLQTLDAFRLAMEGPPQLFTEVRLRPLTDPLRMNGCAMLVINPPAGVEADAGEAAGWITDNLRD